MSIASQYIRGVTTHPELVYSGIGTQIYAIIGKGTDIPIVISVHQIGPYVEGAKRETATITTSYSVSVS